jgi:protein phosphatase
MGETRVIVPPVDVASRSDPGRDPSKQVNEDACGWRETAFGVLCVVCDGMGGHVGGREASNAALATIFESFERATPGTPARDVLRDAIKMANVRVRGLPAGESALGRPGSTVVALLVHGGGTEVAHVGDSRIYFVHQGMIDQVTRDHSMVQEMVAAKILTPAQAAVHPEANKITRALGIEDDVDVELRASPIPHVVGDAFVLCSDGLSDLVEPHEILATVTADPPQQAVGKLVDLANARGGHDNVTVLVARPRATAVAVSLPPVAPTAPESQMVTLRPPEPGAPKTVAMDVRPVMPTLPAGAPPPVPAAPTIVEAPANRVNGARFAVLTAAVAALAIAAIVFARSQHHVSVPAPRSAHSTIAPATPAATAAPTATATPSHGPTVLAPVEPPDAGEIDASELAPLAPGAPSAIPEVHLRKHRP